MPFSAIVRALGRSPLSTELLSKLDRQKLYHLSGAPRLPKGLIASALAQNKEQNLLVVCATLEEAGRWAAQLEAMGWQTIHLYPTSETSPYEPFDPETEMIWGQMQVLADLITEEKPDKLKKMAIVATHAALQPHLPPQTEFLPFCLTLKRGMELDLKTFSTQLANLGYDRVPLVEIEGQWSRRGDIVDVFPVASELPVRLDWFGDELQNIREFDPATQRSTPRNTNNGAALDKIEQIILTPTNFGGIITAALTTVGANTVKSYLSELEQEQFDNGQPPEGSRRFLGIAFEQPASLLDYLPKNTLIVIDENDQCIAFYINPGLSVPGLTLAQVKDIFTGKVTNWQELGGPDLKVTPFSRNAKAGGTVDFFIEGVLEKQDLGSSVQEIRDTTESIRQVAKMPGGIGYATASEVIGQKAIRPLPLAKDTSQGFISPFAEGNITVNQSAFADGSYPLTRRLFVVIRRDGRLDEQAGVAYANLILSNEGQELVKKAGFVALH